MFHTHHHVIMQGRRKGGAGGTRAPPIFLKGVQSTPNIQGAEHPLASMTNQSKICIDCMYMQLGHTQQVAHYIVLCSSTRDYSTTLIYCKKNHGGSSHDVHSYLCPDFMWNYIYHNQSVCIVKYSLCHTYIYKKFWLKSQ